MKKTGYLVVICFMLSCSIDDKEELTLEEGNVQEIAALIEIDGCTPWTFNFEDAGVIEVINDENTLYISVIANSGYSLSRTRIQIGNELSDFPTVGQGNLPPGKMEIDKKFHPNLYQYTFEFPLMNYSEAVYIASFSEFSFPENKIEAWAGDNPVNAGNWSYIEYIIQTCELPCSPIDAGSNNSVTLTYSQAKAIPNKDRVKEFYLNMLDEGVNRNGTFNPTIDVVIEEFADQDPTITQTYSTIYTIGEGECKDYVELSLTVIPDSE